MPIELLCSGCGRTLRVAEEYVGRRAACPVCHSIVQVPFPAVAETAERSPTAESPPAAAPEVTGGAALESRDESEWSLRTPEGREYGPVVRSTLDQWVIDGRVTHDCELRRSGDSWQSADRVYRCLRPQPPAPRAPRLSPTTPPPRPRASRRERTAETKGPNRAGDSGTPSPSGKDDSGNAGSSEFLVPDRGVLIVSLAILGWLLCPILSLAAWVMATSDLKEMQSGRMDRRGYGLTQAGRIMAILHMMAIVAAIMIGLSAMLVYLGANKL